MSQRPASKKSPEGYRPFIVPKALKIINGGISMNKPLQKDEGMKSASPIKNKVGSIFVPVRDIEQSRNWYCRILGLNEDDCGIISGHLCPLPMEGVGVILDTMPMWGGKEPAERLLSKRLLLCS
ncbi:hypothetical protein ACFPPD_12330 [Cohnella suwonensis]|uniref:Glyoxalase/fosfomycin resistance/dioxygenase domain-containing protein n=1 Tax=Cohnella suwonensis TaxID=696072 RepID=A0ABW0LW11_9BACL